MKAISKGTLILMSALLFCLGTGGAHGAAFPEKPITLIVHPGAGGIYNPFRSAELLGEKAPHYVVDRW